MAGGDGWGGGFGFAKGRKFSRIPSTTFRFAFRQGADGTVECVEHRSAGVVCESVDGDCGGDGADAGEDGALHECERAAGFFLHDSGWKWGIGGERAAYAGASGGDGIVCAGVAGAGGDGAGGCGGDESSGVWGVASAGYYGGDAGVF